MTTSRYACANCGRAVFRATSGTWYHRANASVCCVPGWASKTASPREVPGRNVKDDAVTLAFRPGTSGASA